MCVCVRVRIQTELVDVRWGKRKTLRQTNKNRKKESGQIKEQGEEKREQTEEGRKH